MMVHTKSISPLSTFGWDGNCGKEKNNGARCWIGFDWPAGEKDTETTDFSNATDDGYLYNCWVNERVEKYWVPLLENALKKRLG
mmetsp:Transcript_40430/g.49249  ORF Transcript_40430/g.49249 Transcript_40430/m.49249 type:complete len:84 (-) Transcript_40430:4-255(-)